LIGRDAHCAVAAKCCSGTVDGGHVHPRPRMAESTPCWDATRLSPSAVVYEVSHDWYRATAGSLRYTAKAGTSSA
jgi:hypothetical protein